ncbi:hypothetical protein FKW77_002393 [Venturia effusa]|uniref:Uncharacterized protein n=1 Tax=Venturia effusa TaxID=50376 RepID=A0A517L8T2_9PEZI|nr:hypothetical protein FKW77_002393 [Venturia effusa]
MYAIGRIAKESRLYFSLSLIVHVIKLAKGKALTSNVIEAFTHGLQKLVLENFEISEIKEIKVVKFLGQPIQSHDEETKIVLMEPEICLSGQREAHQVPNVGISTHTNICKIPSSAEALPRTGSSRSVSTSIRQPSCMPNDIANSSPLKKPTGQRPFSIATGLEDFGHLLMYDPGFEARLQEGHNESNGGVTLQTTSIIDSTSRNRELAPYQRQSSHRPKTPSTFKAITEPKSQQAKAPSKPTKSLLERAYPTDEALVYELELGDLDACIDKLRAEVDKGGGSSQQANEELEVAKEKLEFLGKQILALERSTETKRVDLFGMETSMKDADDLDSKQKDSEGEVAAGKEKGKSSRLAKIMDRLRQEEWRAKVEHWGKQLAKVKVKMRRSGDQK